MITHVCGQCQAIFASEKDYLVHQCPITKSTPVHNPHPTPPSIKGRLLEKDILEAVRTARQNKKT
jgi:uncharacterized C2H2 Zn-finger protein